MAIGAELRQARERRGISLDVAAREARIPVRYLEALERGDLTVFGRGPFATGYTRQYRRFLGLPEVSLAAYEPEPTSTTQTVTGPLLPTRRRLAGLVGAVAAVLGMAWLVGQAAMDPGPTDINVPPDQVVLLSTGEPVRAKITADGRTVFSGALPAGPQQRFEAHDRLELDLAHLDGVSLVYNGRTLKPLGAQSRPRRLVFIDDRGQ